VGASAGHTIGPKGAENSVQDKLPAGYVRKVHSLGAVEQPVDVLVELEDGVFVDAETFPHSVAALHGGVEDGDFGQLAW
jgi:hypothetical protein